MSNRTSRLAGRWDVVLIALIAVALVAGSLLSPFFLNVDNLLSQTRDLMVIGFLAIGLMPVVIMGDIDLSGESILAVCAIALGLMFEAGVDIWAAAGVAVVLGGLLGAANGLLTVLLRIPSLVVTLATLISLRGLAFVLVEDRPIVGFGESFVALGNGSVGNTAVPQSLVAFLAVAIPVWCVLNLSVAGRWLYAIGSNVGAARLSGIPVDAVRIVTFAFSGTMAGCAAIVLAAHYDSVRADAAQGAVLSVLTVVLLGGVSIFGGVGNLGGVLLSLVLVGLVQNGMRLANISAEPQALVIGGLLIFSVVIPRIVSMRRTRPALELPP
jgi:rhamnose transport system permease protein